MEYAPDETDRLSSFKAAAALLHCTQQEALCGMLAKHIVSVYDMCLAGSEHYGIQAYGDHKHERIYNGTRSSRQMRHYGSAGSIALQTGSYQRSCYAQTDMDHP